MNDYFIYDGIDSRTFNAYVFDAGTDGAPAREYEELAIPNRNGALLLSGSRFPNQIHSYNAVIVEQAEANLTALRALLTSRNSYKRLTDSIHPNEFYKAIYRADFETEATPDRKKIRCLIEFERKPERWLTSGERVTTLTRSGSISNPTQFEAKPLLRIYGRGTVQIGNNAITITECDRYTDIDCEICEAYKGTESKNDLIEIQNIDFPVLNAGENNIVIGSGIGRVEITPRWYTI